MTKFKKNRAKTELQTVKDECKAQGFDYDKTQLSALYDTMGNIIFIETTDVKLQNILKSKGFETQIEELVKPKPTIKEIICPTCHVGYTSKDCNNGRCPEYIKRLTN